MDLKDLIRLKNWLHAECCRLTTSKSNDYADHGDVLLNFRRSAGMFGMQLSDVIKTRLADKLARLHQLTSGKQQMVDESIQDTVCDAHNYLDLWLVAIIAECELTDLAKGCCDDHEHAGASPAKVEPD